MGINGSAGAGVGVGGDTLMEDDSGDPPSPSLVICTFNSTAREDDSSPPC